MSETLSGGCQCGAVTYKIEAEPLFTAICHCRQCQRATGSASHPLIAVPRAAVAISGEVRHFETIADSGQPVRRGFCPSCGCRLFGLPDIAPDLMTISVGNLDDPSGFEPGMHIFTSSAQPWDRIEDDLPKFPGLPPRPAA